ncbi:hypothetical protein NPIL_460961 [Nephila pilipes]|uniref:Uncharacterized protein n=1 Tax=Nephila pilipes TaxID=299642 RepID=A0A8X6NE32_NEPPI|nr:hypothetical protein NPIL_460961 [Nephila pilipes]
MDNSVIEEIAIAAVDLSSQSPYGNVILSAIANEVYVSVSKNTNTYGNSRLIISNAEHRVPNMNRICRKQCIPILEDLIICSITLSNTPSTIAVPL